MIRTLLLTTSALFSLVVAQSSPPPSIPPQGPPDQASPSNVPFQQQPVAGGSYFPWQFQPVAPLSGVGVMPQQGSPFNEFQPQQSQNQFNPYSAFLTPQQQIPPNFNPFAYIPQQDFLGFPSAQHNLDPFHSQPSLNQPVNSDNQNSNQKADPVVNIPLPQVLQPNAPILNSNPFNSPNQPQQYNQLHRPSLVQPPTPQQSVTQPPSQLFTTEPVESPAQPTQSSHSGPAKRDDCPSPTDSITHPTPFLTKAWVQARPDIPPGFLNQNHTLSGIFAFEVPTSLPSTLATGTCLPFSIPDIPSQAISVATETPYD